MLNTLSRTILIVALLFSCSMVWAQTSSFGVKPPGITLKGAPGTTIPGSFLLENTSKKTGTYTLTLSGFVQIPKGQISKPLSALPPSHLARAIKLETRVLTLPAHSTKKINFTVDLPAGFTGTEYAGLTVSQGDTTTDEEQQNRSTEYKKRIGMGVQTAITLRIIVHSTEGGSYSYKVNSITVQGATTTRPLSATAKISNTGNSELKIDPIIVLLDPSGNAVGRMKATGGVTLTPGSNDTIEFTSTGSKVASGTYKAILTIPNPQYQLKPFETTVTVK